MNKNELLNNFRSFAGELMESIKGDQQSAPKNKAVPKTKAPAKSAPKKPAGPRAMQELIQRGVILLLIFICCFSVIFASCAKADNIPATKEETPVTESAPPAVTPAV